MTEQLTMEEITIASGPFPNKTNDQLKEYYRESKSRTKRSLWILVGTALLGVVICSSPMWSSVPANFYVFMSFFTIFSFAVIGESFHFLRCEFSEDFIEKEMDRRGIEWRNS